MTTVVAARDAYLQARQQVTRTRLALGRAISEAREQDVQQSEIAKTLGLTREQVEQGMVDYMAAQGRHGVPWPYIARHMLGLWNGTPGARAWRQVWSDHRHKALMPAEVARRALTARQRGAPMAP